jgi:SWI/SNF-related matrix-associated actin-dependent regulator 1 of chromatin subfamily A
MKRYCVVSDPQKPSLISRLHCTLTLVNPGVVSILDNKSVNGTFLNQVKIDSGTARVGDEVYVGGLHGLKSGTTFDTSMGLLRYRVTAPEKQKNVSSFKRGVAAGPRKATASRGKGAAASRAKPQKKKRKRGVWDSDDSGDYSDEDEDDFDDDDDDDDDDDEEEDEEEEGEGRGNDGPLRPTKRLRREARSDDDGDDGDEDGENGGDDEVVVVDDDDRDDDDDDDDDGDESASSSRDLDDDSDDSAGSSGGRGPKKLDTRSAKVSRRIAGSLAEMLSALQRVSEKLRSVLDLMNKTAGARSAEVDQALNFEMVRRPSGLGAGTELKPYQVIALNWMLLMRNEGQNGILADEMGLGKTVTMLAYLAALADQDGPRRSGPHLIVAPGSTCGNWSKEIERWCPGMTYLAYEGAEKDRAELRKGFARQPTDLVLMSFSFFKRESRGQKDDRRWLRSVRWDQLVIDEAHTLKSSESGTTQRMRKIRSRSTWMLTGTPIQNNLHELFSILTFVNPNIFKNVSPEELIEAVAEQTAGGGGGGGFGGVRAPRSLSQNEAAQRIRRLVAPFYLRRLKSEVMSQLPPKTSHVIEVEMGKDQAELYQGIIDAYRNQRDDRAAKKKGARMGQLKSIFTDLRKVTNHPLLILHRYAPDEVLTRIAKVAQQHHHFGPTARVDVIKEELRTKSDFDIHHDLCAHYAELADLRLPMTPATSGRGAFPAASSAKLDYLANTLLPQLKRDGHRVLLFSQWTMILDLYEIAFQGVYTVVRLDGSTPMATRQAIIEEWNAGTAFLFLITARAGGLGLNLIGADTVIINDLDFNPAVNRQCEDRCHRVGQTKPVVVYRLLTKNSIDRKVYDLTERKMELDAQILGQGTLEMGEVRPEDYADEQHIRERILQELQII